MTGSSPQSRVRLHRAGGVKLHRDYDGEYCSVKRVPVVHVHEEIDHFLFSRRVRVHTTVFCATPGESVVKSITSPTAFGCNTIAYPVSSDHNFVQQLPDHKKLKLLPSLGFFVYTAV